jgi:ABC-type oligopeptide transport system ATPase subunit
MSEIRNGSIIEVKNVTKVFRGARKGLVSRAPDQTVVDDVNFCLQRGELLGLLGESGCGKSTLARMLMHLLPPTSGQILFDGVSVESMPEASFRKYRRRIQMVYQNPFDCLDPSMLVRSLLEEPLKIWFPNLDMEARVDKIRNILEECGLPEDSLIKYPREFSGGQLQRISIARALLIEPEVLIADEIISALDVSIQNQILNLLMDLKERHHLSILFITHDLSVARRMSDRVMVMQTGQIKGIGTPEKVFTDSADPYIRALDRAVFTFDGRG